MLWRKQKYAQYKTFKQLLLYSATATQHGCYRSKIVVKQIIKHVLRLENHEFLIFFLWCQIYRLEDAKRNVLDLTEFRNQVHYRKFLRKYVVVIYTSFGSSQPPVSLEMTTIASMTREMSTIILKKVTEKRADLFITYLLRLILYGFLLPRRHVMFSNV